MAHKRVVRVISYEGKDSWVDEVLSKTRLKRTIFSTSGTVKELQRIELQDGEELRLVEVNKVKANVEPSK